MSRAPQHAQTVSGPLSPELARVVEAIARDMARQDHEAQLSAQPEKPVKRRA